MKEITRDSKGLRNPEGIGKLTKTTSYCLRISLRLDPIEVVVGYPGDVVYYSCS